jgi:hypothetical protein
VPLLHIEIFLIKSTKILIFGGISKFCLWQILANFSNFG